MLAALMLAASPANGAIEDSPPDPSSSADPKSSQDPVGPTSVTTSPADFSPTGFVAVSGTRQPGSSVTVTRTDTGAAVCAVKAADAENWSCTGLQALPNGADISLTATETPAEGEIAPGTITVDVLGPPTMDGSGSYLTTGLVSGSGNPGSTVAVSIDGEVDPNCSSVPVSASTYWSCNVSTPTGGPYFVRSQQSDSAIGGGSLSDYSDVRRVTVDRDAPAAAVITSPRSEGRIVGPQIVISGTGESGSTVDVYVNDIPACTAAVANGTWACDIGTHGKGPHMLQALQRDAAGNFAAPSEQIRVYFGPRDAGAPPPAPSPAAPSETPAPAPEPEPSPDDADTAPLLPTRPDIRDWSAPAPDEALTNWGTPTGFGGTLTTFTDSVRTPWYSPLILSLAFLSLIALPLRLLASALRGRLRLSRTQLTGRNLRTDPTADVPRPINPWLAGAVPVAAAAGLIVLTGGVEGEVRYLRLALAVSIGLAILNIVGTAMLTRLGSGWTGTSRRLRFVPIMLLAAALASMASRWTGMDPPLVAGVLIGAVFAAATPVRPRAIVNLIHVGGILVLGVLGWLAHGVLGPVQGFWGSLASETLATLCLAGLGSALVLVLPIATLPGRVILEWSLAAWVATVLLVAGTVATVVYGTALTGAVLPWLGSAAVFAAVSLAMWLFVRFVEPRATA
ncbi:hypothetical protein ABIB15_001662 [Marisediminicola sp. UYEF4]|uniref:hypothetical protein n=1 Tax=Marisediminicola sp. UYEF4 TaxID=1756384 RepID=UPI003393AD80